MAGRALPGPVNYAQIPELAERGMARLRQFLDDLEQRLAVEPYLATGRFSLADITAVVAVDFARIIQIRPEPERHPALLRWRARLAERPSMAL